MFAGIESAEIFKTGKYLPAGFRGRIKVAKVLTKQTIKSGLCFIIEMQIVQSNLPEAEPGSTWTWLVKMVNPTTAFPAIKSWAAACAGYASDDPAIETEVAPNLAAELDSACKSPDANSFVGCEVTLETVNVTTTKGMQFTKHLWAPG
jgi:hypothetical protein